MTSTRSERPMRAVCVFCGSSSGARADYAVAAGQMGSALAARGLEVVTGAGHIGLMGVVADAALSAGGRVVGVIPQSLVQHELAHQGLSDLLIVETMHQRKALMADRADAFVALPGGYGTLDELFEILTWAQLGLHACPVGLLNVAGYFDPLLAWVDQAVSEGFVRDKDRRALLVAREVEELLERLLAYRPDAESARWISEADR